jgi:hypothetical protein
MEDGAMDGKDRNSMREIVEKMENTQQLNLTVTALREDLAAAKK